MSDETITFTLSQEWRKWLEEYGHSNNLDPSLLAKKIVIDALDKFVLSGERVR